MNISKTDAYQPISSLMRVLGHPMRIRILEEIGHGEACVCHLEAQLGVRQAHLSQQLMALREAGVLETNRDGRFVYYRVADKRVLTLITTAADIKQIELETSRGHNQSCDCPKCCKSE